MYFCLFLCCQHYQRLIMYGEKGVYLYQVMQQSPKLYKLTKPVNYSRVIIISYFVKDFKLMKPTKISLLQNQPEQQADITDIAEIFQKLNNCNRSQALKPYSEYDPESIFPPPSLVSANNNDNESQKSKSNNCVNIWKRSGVSEGKEEISFSSKYELHTKKIKKIEVEKVVTTPNNTFPHPKEDQVSNRGDSLINLIQQIPLHPQVASFKITDFFGVKKIAPKVKTCEIDEFQIRQEQKAESSPQKKQKINSFSQIQQPKTNPIISLLVEKNIKRRQTIKELREELIMVKNRKQNTRNNLNGLKQDQKKKLKAKLFQTNQRKLQFQQFNSKMRIYLNQKQLQISILPSLNAKIKSLDQQKKKASQKKGANKRQIHTDQQSIGNTFQQNNYNQNPHLIPDKKNYINQWISKLQKFREKVETDQSYYHKLYQVQRKSQEVPQDVSKAFQTNNLLKDYVLFSIEYPYATTKASAQELGEINCFNTEFLRNQTLTLLKYPKLSSQSSKNIIQKEISNLFKLSKKLHNSASFYFLQTTTAFQLGEKNDFIVYGRQKNEDFQSLIDVLHKYETFSQVMVRYIARVCLIALEQVKVKVDIPLFFLPLNIYFTSKYDIKFSSILMNNLFLHEEFRPYLKEQKFYYFVAPEALSQKDYSGLSIWSLGILLYFIIYQKYPFEYELEVSFLKETFFIYNELTFPSRPLVNQKLKDFIAVCLNGKQRDLTQLLKHQFFHK